MTHRFLALFPELLNENGDSENAAVLARRANWAGRPAEATAVSTDEPWPRERPQVVVLGSGPDSALARVAEALGRERERLAEWLAAGTRMLAVGSGMELLADSIPLGKETIAGLGFIDASVEALKERVSGDLVVDAAAGRLVGFENHSRRIVPSGTLAPLGTVAIGIGDGDRRDGVRTESIIGTRMHGPVLALNPGLADALLREALGEHTAAESAEAKQADSYAASAREAILRAIER